MARPDEVGVAIYFYLNCKYVNIFYHLQMFEDMFGLLTSLAYLLSAPTWKLGSICISNPSLVL